MVKPVPEGFHTLTPILTVRGAAAAIDFYRRAFGAEEVFRSPGPDGRIMHAQLRIGNSVFMLHDEFPEMGGKGPAALGGTPVGLWIYTDEVDAAWKRAVDAGATVKMPLSNQFWGDRFGMVEDPFGHQWSLAQHIEDVPREEMPKRAQAAMAQQKKQP